MAQKRFLYKLINENKDNLNKITVNNIWKKYMQAPDSETSKKGKSIIQDKEQLITIIEALEKDNLVMYSSEDGDVILI